MSVPREDVLEQFMAQLNRRHGQVVCAPEVYAFAAEHGWSRRMAIQLMSELQAYGAVQRVRRGVYVLSCYVQDAETATALAAARVVPGAVVDGSWALALADATPPRLPRACAVPRLPGKRRIAMDIPAPVTFVRDHALALRSGVLQPGLPAVRPEAAVVGWAGQPRAHGGMTELVKDLKRRQEVGVPLLDLEHITALAGRCLPEAAQRRLLAALALAWQYAPIRPELLQLRRLRSSRLYIPLEPARHATGRRLHAFGVIDNRPQLRAVSDTDNDSIAAD